MTAERSGSKRAFFGRLFNYANNAVTIIGIVLTTVSALTIIGFFMMGVWVGIQNPYANIISFLILPAFFVVGLLLIPIGMLRRSRKLRKAGATAEELDRYPHLDFNNRELRRFAGIILGLTALNMLILGVASYKGVSYMDTAQFCGTTCHSLMQPEYTAYQQSPHSRVECVECHIGPGASWFVKSKLDGLRQVWKTTFDTYDRPIETPVKNLRPAQATCEHCHWPKKHHGDKLWVFARFGTDEANTPSYNAMLIKTGGGSLDLGAHGGIHWWHIYSDNKIEYVSDEKHQEMYWVRLTLPDGTTRVYTRDGDDKVTDQQIAEARTMDCIDCHNRPTHHFLVPAKALDQVLEDFPEFVSLPYYKKQALEAIKGDYPSHAAGMKAVKDAVLQYYKEQQPDVWESKKSVVERSADEAARVYGRSVFPEMKTNWETHPYNIGHDDFPGCWRCHDSEMSTADGKHVIPQDCDTCHAFIVEDSATRPDLPGELTQLAQAHES